MSETVKPDELENQFPAFKGHLDKFKTSPKLLMILTTISAHGESVPSLVMYDPGRVGTENDFTHGTIELGEAGYVAELGEVIEQLASSLLELINAEIVREVPDETAHATREQMRVSAVMGYLMSEEQVNLAMKGINIPSDESDPIMMVSSAYNMHYMYPSSNIIVSHTSFTGGDYEQSLIRYAYVPSANCFVREV